MTANLVTPTANLPQTQVKQTDKHAALTFDLVIVGGGLVGLTLASALKDSGLRVAVVEATKDSAAIARGQAYHINLQSSRIFRGMGVWGAMEPEVNPIQQIRLSDADYASAVQFLPPDLGTPVLGYVAEHRVLFNALQNHLQQCPDVTYLCPAELVKTDYQPDGVFLTVQQGEETQLLHASLLVAADGARSPIRQQAGIQTRGWQYAQACVVAFIRPEQPHQNIAYERFWPSGPFAILPLPDNLCRIVWTAPRAEAEAILALSDDDFLARLQQRYGDQMGQLSLVGQRYLFPVQLMHSTRYTMSRLVLIGDAAHCCHPVGGQGVNLGFRDAAALAEILTTAVKAGQDIGSEAVLRRYGRWRQPENLVILGFTDLLVRLFSNRILPLVGLRRLGLEGMRWLAPVRQLALRLMTGLTGKVPAIAQSE